MGARLFLLKDIVESWAGLMSVQAGSCSPAEILGKSR